MQSNAYMSTDDREITVLDGAGRPFYLQRRMHWCSGLDTSPPTHHGPRSPLAAVRWSGCIVVKPSKAQPFGGRAGRWRGVGGVHASETYSARARGRALCPKRQLYRALL